MSATRGSRPVAVAGALLCVVAIVGGWRTARSQAEETSPFGSFTLTATAPGFEMTEDEPSANAHPEGGGTAPYSTVVLDSGNAYGLSSVAWPGATEANADKVAMLLLPSAVNAGPVYQPLPPDAVAAAKGVLPLASYPVRAEASTGTQPDASYESPASNLTAHADPQLAQATAAMTGASGAAGFGFGNATSVANASITATTADVTAHVTMNDIDIGGVIKIGSVQSDAKASTDGVAGSSSGSTAITGMTIAGQPAYVDEKGVHVGSQSQPANAVVSQIANQALSQGGFTFHVAEPQQSTDGASADYTAGSLFVVWAPPGSENVFVITLGGARAAATAAPAYDGSQPAAAAGSAATGATGSTKTTPKPARTSGFSATPATSRSATPTPTGSAAPTPLAGLPIAATFEGLGGWVAVGLAGAALLAAGTRRLADEILDRPPSACPQET